MALIIYLDTQDYIKLFNEPADGPNHQVLTKLLAYRDRGEIVIGFSFATVMEFITKPDAANRFERVRRGQLIKYICGPNAFPYPTNIPKGASFPNNGMWIFSAGEKVMSAEECRKIIRETYLDELKTLEGLNRRTKRQLGRKISMRELIHKTEFTWGRKRSDWGEFPVSDEIIESRIVERFMKGQCSDCEFEKRINAWISDPAEYSRLIYDYANQPNIITKYFGKSTDEIERVLGTIQDVVSRFQQINDHNLKTRTSLIEAGMDKSEARKLTKKISVPTMDSETFGAKLEAVLGKGRAGHFGHYMERILKSGYAFKRSDIMDLFQMCYAYDCDLFRCDVAMASTFRDFKPFQGKLVERFVELPARIDALIGSK